MNKEVELVGREKLITVRTEVKAGELLKQIPSQQGIRLDLTSSQHREEVKTSQNQYFTFLLTYLTLILLRTIFQIVSVPNYRLIILVPFAIRFLSACLMNPAFPYW